MLTSRNSGKYLHGKFNRDREDALADDDRFTDDELAFLEVEGVTGYLSRHDEAYLVDIEPVDVATPTKHRAFDIRKKDSQGGI